MRPRHATPWTFLAAVVWLFVTSCGGDDGPSGPDIDPGPDPNAVASVAVSPTTGTLDVGQTLQLTATASNSQGGTVSATVSWSSSATSVATVSSSGLVTGVGAGSATITASAGGRSATATVTVVDPTPPSAPSGLSAVAVSHTAVALAWTDGSSNEAGFSVEREVVVPSAAGASAAQAFEPVATVAAGTTSFRDGGLNAATGYRYRVRAFNDNGASDYTAPAEATTHAVLVLGTTVLDDGTLNQPYDETLVASGGDGTFAWRVSEGALPAGLSLSSAGRISGTPTALGAATFTVEVASGEQTVTRQFTITVNEQILPPEVVSDTLPSGVLGVAYSQTLEARRGDGAYVWALQSGSLPPGLTLSAAGVLSGTPTASGTFTFTVQVASAGLTGTGTIVVRIFPVVSITTQALPPAREGAVYNATLGASGGDGTFTWTALGTLPAGLTLATNGVLSGTPTAPGAFTVSVEVTSGDGQKKSAQLSLQVVALLAISTQALDTARVGVAYSFDLGTDGGSGAITWAVAAGSLPPGIALDQANGELEGTPTGVGSFTFTLRATSADGQTASKELTLHVAPGPVTITTATLPNGVVSQAYSATVSATGGDGANYDFTLQSGALPTGLELAITGQLAGTPTATGAFTFTVLVDSQGQTDTQQYTVTIAAAPPVTITTGVVLPAGTVGQAYGTTLSATGGDGTYAWSVTSGALPAGLSLNGSTGVISGTPTASGTANFTVQATSGGQSTSKAFSLTIAAGPTPGFQIELVYTVSMNATFQAAFNSAKARWQQLVTGDLPDINQSLAAACGNPAVTTPIDDLTIFVGLLTGDDSDGPGGVLGSAGPCYIRPSSTLPITGQMNFDEADLQQMADNGILTEVILHEMGHVLGIGTLWTELGLRTGECTIDPFFTGARALAAYNAAGGGAHTTRSAVPVHAGPDPEDGSVCGHWEESILDHELMTPQIGGAGNPLSRITTESLGDMGYTVNSGAADAYSVPAPLAVAAPAAAGTRVRMVDDVYRGPIYRVWPDGRVEEVPRRRR